MINIETTAGVPAGETGHVTQPNRAARRRQMEDFAGDISAEEIRAELGCIIGSSDFRASERNRRVLQYLVECALQGRGEDVSAYHIATRIYGRPKNFNACSDPIVRIEMAHLRRDLETYYLKGGRANALRISIPKGGYFPSATRSVPGDESCGSTPASPYLVSVLRAALRAWSGAGDAAAAACQDLQLADPALFDNLHASVLREVGDEEVARLIVEGVLRSARQKA